MAEDVGVPQDRDGEDGVGRCEHRPAKAAFVDLDVGVEVSPAESRIRARPVGPTVAGVELDEEVLRPLLPLRHVREVRELLPRVPFACEHDGDQYEHQ